MRKRITKKTRKYLMNNNIHSHITRDKHTFRHGKKLNSKHSFIFKQSQVRVENRRNTQIQHLTGSKGKSHNTPIHIHGTLICILRRKKKKSCFYIFVRHSY